MTDKIIWPDPPTPGELDVYMKVAKQMLAEHVKEHPDHPACGITFRFQEQEVVLTYFKTTGDEKPFVEYQHNALKTRPVGHLLHAFRDLQAEGILV